MIKDFIVYGFTEAMLDRIDMNQVSSEEALQLAEAQCNDMIWHDNDIYIDAEIPNDEFDFDLIEQHLA